MHGQVVVGPPGSGKSSYCKAVQDYLRDLGRDVEVINLDPGNEELIYECSLDVCDLVNVEDVMEHEGLGPNGAMIFCMEHLKKNIHWLHEKLAGKPKNSYFIFDCPGQIELYTHNDAVNEIFQHLIKTLKLHLVSILLLDSSHISDTNTYISLLTTTLLSMLRIELPHLAILCKSDLIRHDDLPFNIEYFTQVQDLKQLIHQDGKESKQVSLQEGLVDVIERYGLVSYHLLCNFDKEMLANVVKQADRLCLYKHTVK